MDAMEETIIYWQLALKMQMKIIQNVIVDVITEIMITVIRIETEEDVKFVDALEDKELNDINSLLFLVNVLLY